MRKIICQPKDAIATFVAGHVGAPEGWTNFSALALLGDRGIMAGVIYSRWTSHDAHVTLAVVGRATPEFVFAAFDYPFNQVGLRRVSALARASNLRSIRLAQHLGFTLEGRLRRAAGSEDILLFGLLREECRWTAPTFLKEKAHEFA